MIAPAQTKTTSEASDRNHYADHLAAINKNNAVLTTEDVLNDKGAVIVPKGTTVTPEIANKIARFKLSQPLERNVNLEQVITPKKLHDEILQLNREYSEIGGASPQRYKKILARQCILFCEYPLLTQKLTVLSERLPRIYRNALITSSMALSVCEQMGLDEQSTHVVFAATQMHDAGLLNVSPELVNKKGSLSRAEWRILQGHVVIGKVFLDMVPRLPKAVGRAVFEHHERLDGTGYPKGKMANELSLEGQVIAFVDTVNAIFHNRLRPLGYTQRDLIPVLQMNSHVYPKQVHDSFMRMMQSGRAQTTRVISNDRIKPLAEFLLVLQKLMMHWFKLAKELSVLLSESDVTARTQQVVLMIERLEETVNQSGLFTFELRDWLRGVIRTQQASDFQEVEYTALMFDEFCYQLQQLHKLIDLAVQGRGGVLEEKSAGLGALLKDIPNNRLKVTNS